MPTLSPSRRHFEADRRMHRILRYLVRIVDWMASGAIVVLMIALLGLVFSQFLDRNVIEIWRGFPADEYVKVGLIWLTFVGFGLAMRSGVEIRVDLVDHYLSAKFLRILYLTFDAVILILLGIVIQKSVLLYQVGNIQAILGTVMTVAFPTLGMLLGCGLMFLSVLLRLLRRAFHIEI